ncbi:MAG: XdhC family protein [Pseudomonadales bacterium]
MSLENADQQVLSQLTDWIKEGIPSWLCTVVETWGSSPRPIGSLLACNSKGHLVGSLSGGCIEEDLLEQLQTGQLAKEAPLLHIYGVTQAETERFGLPCGGQLHVVIEPFADDHHLADLQRIVSSLERRESIQRQVDLASGDMTLKDVDRFQHLKLEGDFSQEMAAGPRSMRQTFGPRYQLFLIGCGQVSQYLAEMAKALDYHVIVCDPRPHLMEQWPVKGVQLITGYPDDAIRSMARDSYSAIVALTHDPRIDDMGLMEALQTDAYFIGAMGSKKTSANRRERLKQLDLTDAEIDRLHAPVGLPLGSKTPAEIAVAILAQLVALRANDGRMQADFRAAG